MALLEDVTSLVPRTLYHILALPDAAVSFKWLVQLPSLPKPIEGNGSSESSSSGNGLFGKISSAVSAVTNVIQTVSDTLDNVAGPTLMMMRAREVKVPLEDIKSNPMLTQARERSFPTSISVNNLDITFYEDYNYTALTYLEKWKKSIINDYGVFNTPINYVKDIKVHVYDTVGLRKGTFTFEDCYPESISQFSFNSDSGLIDTTCSFNVHRVKWSPSAINWGSSISSIKAGFQNYTDFHFY